MGEFAKAAKRLTKQAADWEKRLEQQRGRLHAQIPSFEEEAQGRAAALHKLLNELAFKLGYGQRAAVHEERGVEQLLPREQPAPGVPGREVVIDLPSTKRGWYEPRLRSKKAAEKKALLGAITDPIGEKLEDTRMDLARAADLKKRKLTRVTGHPGTLPTFYPSLALSVPSSYVKGYEQADVDVDTRLRGGAKSRMLAARKTFEEALKAEYSESKIAESSGELIDGLADRHVKRAEGEFNQLLGMYLAMAALLGQGSHVATKKFVEQRDPRYQKFEAVREAIQARMRAAPPPVLVAPEETSKIQETSPELVR